MTSCNATHIPSYSPTIDITSFLRSWCPPERIDEITMAQIRLDMMAVDSLVQPRLDRIQELESEIARLRAEVAVISPTLDKYHSLHAPIRRLPPELLLSVFGHLESGPMPLKDDTPWLLTRVCSSWRDLVTHTPTLWSTIKMECPFGWWNFLTSSDPSALLTCSLRYSNNAPLDVTLTTQNIRATNPIAILLRQHSTRWRSLVANSGEFIPNDLPALEKLDLRISSGLFDTLQAPRLHTLILGELHSIPFSRFPSLRCLECSIIDSAQLIALLDDAKQLTSLRVDCWDSKCLVPENLSGSSIISSLLELHLPVNVPISLSHISFPMLHSLTLGLPLCCHPSTQTDVDILNNLHCPRLRTLILNESISILSLNRLLSYPIARLDLVVTDNSVYHALNSTPLLHLEDLRITDNSGSGSGEILRVVKAKKSLRNVEVKSASFARIKELFLTESFPEELTIRCWNAPAQVTVFPRIRHNGSSRDAVIHIERPFARHRP